MSALKLSNRITNSLDGLKQLFMSHQAVTEVFLTGQSLNCKRFISRERKYYLDIKHEFDSAFESLAIKVENEEERVLMAQLMPLLKALAENQEKLVAEKLGKIDENVLSEPIAHNIYCYAKHYDYYAKNGTFLDLLVMLLAILNLFDAMVSLKFDQKFKPNIYYDIWSIDEKMVTETLDVIKSLIDSRGVGVSGSDEKRLIEVSKRATVFEYVFFDSCWTTDPFMKYFC